MEMAFDISVASDQLYSLLPTQRRWKLLHSISPHFNWPGLHDTQDEWEQPLSLIE